MTSPKSAVAPSADWIEDSIRWRGTVLTGKRAHWCPEWDFLPVDETCAEFETCTCVLDIDDAE